MDETDLQNVVQTSTKYDKFKFIVTNRERNQGHIEKLKKAFQEVGNLTRVQPILVNEKMEIIDGQHRFEAAKDLGEPIYFTMRKGLGVNEARSMNILQRPWNVDDYAESYINSGNRNYIDYMRLREDYGFNHSITLLYAYGGDATGLSASFRDGSFVLPDLPGAIKRLDMLASVAEISPDVARYRPFAAALLSTMRVEGYDHKEFLKKLELNADSLMKRLGNIPDNQRMIEDIYNHSTRVGNRLRLY